MSGADEERGRQMQDLGNFVETTRQRLAGVLSVLSWTQKSVFESQPTLTCSFNSGHRVRRENFNEHLEKCQWKAEGYAADELPLSEPCSSSNAWSAVNFGNFGDKLIPRTSDRLVATFTSSERKASYDCAIANTIKPVIGYDIADMTKLAEKNRDGPKATLLELLVQERDLKRRRAKHRGVHTNKKSDIEILREVIDQQMEMYQEYLAAASTNREPESSDASQTHLLDSHGSDEQKYYYSKVAEKSSTNRLGKGSGTNGQGHSAESSHTRTILPYSSSPTNCTGSDRVWKGHRSESKSGEKERMKHSRKQNDNSKGRNRHEDGGRRHRHRDEDLWAGDEPRQFGRKYERRKRRRSHDRSDKFGAKSRRHELTDDDDYCTYQRQSNTCKSPSFRK